MTREEAIQELEFILVGHPETSARGQAVLMAIEALEQPEIIRCTDCKYAAKQGNVNWCDKLMCYGVDDWYCASARRREE